jgi:hypothetical protein
LQMGDKAQTGSLRCKAVASEISRINSLKRARLELASLQPQPAIGGWHLKVADSTS